VGTALLIAAADKDPGIGGKIYKIPQQFWQTLCFLAAKIFPYINPLKADDSLL
jgi:hypothetical protein